MNLIYQCWTGPIRSGVLASMENMRRYAGTNEYRFDINPNIASKLCDVKYYYEKLNVLLDDSFLAYDKVLVVDNDIFTVEGLRESIFDVPVADIGICTEPMQPEMRSKLSGHICKEKDETWAKMVRGKYKAEMPRENGLLKVYNTGLVLWTRQGIEKARKTFAPFQEYIDAVRATGLSAFYTIDQNYIHAMMVKHLDYTELCNGWNSYVHYIGSPEQKPRPVNDSRNDKTKMVHIQLRGADDYDAEKLWRITNRPKSEWCL